MSQVFFDPRPIELGPNGLPLNQGRLWFYSAGTSTPQSVFTDPELEVPATNPVYLDASGRVPELFMGNGTYKVICEGVTTALPTPARTDSGSIINVNNSDRSITSTFTNLTVINLRPSTGNYSQITLVAGPAGAMVMANGTDKINTINSSVMLSANQRWSVTDTGVGNWTITSDNYVQIWTADNVEGNTSELISTTGQLAVVTNVTAMKTLDPTIYPYIMALGSSYGPYDGGGGFYSWVSGAANHDDGGWYIQRATGGSGRWIRTLLATETALDLRIWGAHTGVSPVDTAVSSALTISSSLTLPVVFPVGFNSRTHTGCDYLHQRNQQPCPASIHAPTLGAITISVTKPDMYLLQFTHPHWVR